ncbi:hypothetical protein KOR42_24230 [Thalassoglobus neptunius]|uniref:Uncharacterized protein n=1 Tax=Thalassoglobus neptunius TaxID=1938619 RepID=A0A5C5X832_9PLAN|nr:hypothetical protein [Thalassoglobus neptunius]TWT59034.1 hypothetical protein KOR42_24230 [Thalassoglobus neptunius]
MQNSPFDQLDLLNPTSDSEHYLERLEELVRESGDLHKVFDVKMLRKKFSLGLPLSRPTSLQDVPEPLRKEVEETYVESAREVGQAFLEKGEIGSAWMYFQVIREQDPVAQAIEELPDQIEDYDKQEEIVRIGLYEGVNPPKAVKIMLNGQGTCSTITALEQGMQTLSQEHRQECAKVLVKSLYSDLTESVRNHVQQKVPMLPPGESLKSLLVGRDWILEGGNYHIDVSHLNAVVRFARSIEAPAEELKLADELALYGSKLEPSLQYGGEPPFEDFYPAHQHFFNVLLDRNRQEGLQYFRDKLEAEPDEQDRPILAYVLVDLLIRSGELDEAVSVSAKYLAQLNEEVSISFDELCVDANRFDVLKETRREQGDLVGYASACLRDKQQTESATTNG